MATLAERLAEDTKQYDFSNQEWVRFIKDHRNYILNNAEVVTIDSTISNTFRYHMTELLKELKLDHRYSWLIKWLNQLHGEWKVVDLDYILVPTNNTMSELWDKYKSFKSKLDKASQ